MDETEVQEQEEVVEVKEEVVEKKQDVVPHAALHEQRMENKKLREELVAQRQTSERMESTFQKLLDNLNTKPAPKYEDDPLGHISARNETLEKELKQVTEKIEGFTKQTSQSAYLHQVSDTLNGSEAEFRAQHPDYDAAVKHLKDVTRHDLADQGMSGAEIEQTLQAGKMGLAHTAIQQGKNPAEVLYERAKRYGFKAKSPEDKIETLAKAQQLGKTVDGSSSAGLTLRDLSQIPEDQIDAIIADDKKWNALIRGESVR